MSDLTALTALIHGRVGQLFSKELGPKLGKITARAGSPNLLQQLRGDAKLPEVDLDFFSGLLDITDLVSERKPTERLRDFFLDRIDDVRRLVEADGPAEVLAVTRQLLTDQLQDLRSTVLPFLGRQFSIALSLVTTLRNLPQAADAVKTALLHYFFTKEGFITVDNLRLSAPAQLGDLDLKSLGRAKALLTERTAERYIRDTIRLIVESAGDVRYDNLRARYDAMRQHLPNDEKREKFADWLRGFSSVAESTVTGAVEEATLGVATFQTNPLLAASASTFAGMAARKAAQHVFLSELEGLLGK
ncbi:MAG TPA: hypothetical protein VNN62_22905 [Methylomirabilota bacterium]|nr:hypothetical protein [Methylomirabilota bacterium]